MKKVKKMNFSVLETEILDNTFADEEGNIQPAEISVSVTVMVLEKKYTLDFQTTTTHDYGAYSSTLESYAGNSDHSDLSGLFDDEDAFIEFLAEVKKAAAAESIWNDYANDTYNLNSDHFGGLDANSEINQAVKK